MINSILDNDLYKFTMQNAVIKKFPRAKVKYEFINRDTNKFPEDFDILLKKEIEKMADLKLSVNEKKFIKEKCYYLDPTYIDFINGFRFDPDEVDVKLNNGELSLSIEGYWYRTILWEVPLLALISELYYRNNDEQKAYEDSKIKEILMDKINVFNNLQIKVADFGTRRRYSFHNHDLVVKTLKEYGKSSFIGTSNVYLAYKYNLTPIGTHAHEWFMFHAAKYGFKNANKLALDSWVDVYRGDLGIALSDTFTSDVFFKSFDKKLAKLFDGVRHDSGDPLVFIDKTIEHYKKNLIDPTTKTIIFSDALDTEKVTEITNYCKNKIRIAFGIGTNLTNDVGVIPLNIVIKMSAAKPENDNWIPTIKLSDVKGKYSGDEEMIKLCKKVLNINNG